MNDTAPKTEVSPEMDFASELFNPGKVLGTEEVTLPFPNATPYNNLAEYHSIVFKKRKRPKNNFRKSNIDFSNNVSSEHRSHQLDSQRCDYAEVFQGKKKQFPCRMKNNRESNSYYDQHRYRGMQKFKKYERFNSCAPSTLTHPPSVSPCDAESVIDSKFPKTQENPEMDFASKSFDSGKLLGTEDVGLPHLNVMPYNNLAEDHSVVSEKRKGPENNFSKSIIDFLYSVANQHGSPHSDVQRCDSAEVCKDEKQQFSCRTERKIENDVYYGKPKDKSIPEFEKIERFSSSALSTVTHPPSVSLCKEKFVIDKTFPEMEVNPEMDFASQCFDPQKVLGAENVTLPYQNAMPCNNLAESHSVVFKKRTGPKNNFSKSVTETAANLHSDVQRCDSAEVCKDEKEQFPCRTERNIESDVYYGQHRDRRTQESKKTERFSSSAPSTVTYPPSVSSSVAECVIDSTFPQTEINPEMDFASQLFDSQKVLGAENVKLPYPKATPYNNLAEYHSIVFGKRKRPKRN